MKPNVQNPLPPQEPTNPGGWQRRVLLLASGLLLIYFITAYLILPMFWRADTKRHPGLSDGPRLTQTANHIPGDPVNIAIEGSESDVIHAMTAAAWYPADPITFRSSVRIAVDSVSHRPDDDAPVSDLFLFGRKQDLAFEKPAGKSASHRHHVRFWKAAELGGEDFPLWIGAITYDQSVGLSRTTGQITHHISADVDAERDLLVNELSKAGWLTEVYQVTGVGATMLGRNGGGDPYFTDGELSVGVLAGAGSPNVIPKHLENPAPVQIKEQLWAAIRPLLKSLPGNEPVE